MHYFISYKFTGVDINELHKLIDPIVEIIKSYGHTVFCNLYCDDMYIENKYTPKQIMEHCFDEIRKCDVCFVLIDNVFGCGMGIECGYAKCLNKKIVICTNTCSNITSIEWISDIIIMCENSKNIFDEITKYFEMIRYVEYYCYVNSKRCDITINVCEMDVFVHKKVFTPDPTITIASKLIIDKLKQIDVKNKTILDMGCGTGILGLYCLKNGASVDFTDIDNDALENTKRNVSDYNNYTIINSNLFDNIEDKLYDVVIFNLPICQEVWNLDVIQMFNKFYSKVLNHLKKCGIAMNVFATFGNIHLIRELVKKHKFSYTEEITNKFNVDWSVFCITNV